MGLVKCEDMWTMPEDGWSSFWVFFYYFFFLQRTDLNWYWEAMKLLHQPDLINRFILFRIVVDSCAYPKNAKRRVYTTKEAIFFFKQANYSKSLCIYPEQWFSHPPAHQRTIAVIGIYTRGHVFFFFFFLLCSFIHLSIVSTLSWCSWHLSWELLAVRRGYTP